MNFKGETSRRDHSLLLVLLSPVILSQPAGKNSSQARQTNETLIFCPRICLKCYSVNLSLLQSESLCCVTYSVQFKVPLFLLSRSRFSPWSCPAVAPQMVQLQGETVREIWWTQREEETSVPPRHHHTSPMTSFTFSQQWKWLILSPWEEKTMDHSKEVFVLSGHHQRKKILICCGHHRPGTLEAEEYREAVSVSLGTSC